MAGHFASIINHLDRIATAEGPETVPNKVRSHSFSEFTMPKKERQSGPLKKLWARKASLPAADESEMASIDLILEERLCLQAESPPKDEDGVPIYLDDLHNARFELFSPTRIPMFSGQGHDYAPNPAKREQFQPLGHLPLPDQDFNAPLLFEGPVGVSGLSNLGNTCFLNAALQCLSATIPLSTYLRSGAYKKGLNRHSVMGSGGYMTRALARLFRVMWSQEHSHVTPLAVRDALWRFAPQFQGFEQQDSQEVLSFFLDQLHEDLNTIQEKPITEVSPKEMAALETMLPLLASQKEWGRSLWRDNSVISHWMHGQERSRLQCLTCNATSTTFTNYNMLSLKIPAYKKKRGLVLTIQDLLDEYTKSEVMPEEDGWKCHHCHEPRAASHTLSVTRLPPILILHISRTVYNDFGLMDKDDRPISFPTSGLELGRFLSPPASGQGLLYDLYAMVNHVGSASAGHYTSLVRSQDSWIDLNDKVASRATPKDVAKHFRSAYILCYRLRQ